MKYIAFLEVEQYLHEKRSVAPSASSVVLYMAKKLRSFDDVQIVSPTRTLCTCGKFKKRTTEIAEGITLTHPSTIGRKTRFGKILSMFYVRLWLLAYLLLRTKRHEAVVVYHSAAFMRVVSIAKCIKGFDLILEVREIYADVSGNATAREKEIKHLTKADKYIFATQILNSIINTENKPYVIATGVYEMAPRVTAKRFEDGKIHIVYAGTLNPKKGGAKIAVDVAAKLPSNYHVHILGYGDDSAIKFLNDEIVRVTATVEAEISYDGCLSGEQFQAFLQGCDIGISTQDTTNQLNASSFPSKVLTYLSNGLNVVSGHIPAVYTSAIGEYVTYYENSSSQEIADAIRSVKKKQDIQRIMDRLDAQLVTDLNAILHEELL